LAYQEQSGSVKFDEYGPITLTEERRRWTTSRSSYALNQKRKLILLRMVGDEPRPREARDRTDRAKRYLIRKCRLDPARIVIVDGGYREEATTELFIRLENGKPPIAFPTVDRSKVKIVNARETGKR
jgi:hypothetical protein